MEMITIPVSVPKDMLPSLDFEESGFSFEQSAMLLYPDWQKFIKKEYTGLIFV